MALGSDRSAMNNGSRKSDYNYYSGLKIRNYNDHTGITISFSGGLMKIGIAKEGDNHRYEDELAASLTPKKVAILLDQMAKVEAGEKGAFGTVVGMSEIQTAIALQDVNDGRHLRIAKVAQDGKIQDQRTFTFPKESDAGMKWSDFDGMKYTKEFNDNIDYQLFKNALEDFVRGISGAYAYGGLYMNRYNEFSTSNKLNAALEKLGVQVNTGGYRATNNGFFSGNNNAGSAHKTYTDIESMISDDDDE